MAYKFRAGEQVSESTRRCAREQLDKALKALRDGIHTDPVGSVHTARKAIKKERALGRLARRALPSDQRRAANETLRDAARRLSGLRDAEVMLQALDKLGAPGTGPVREQLERGRASEHERAAHSEAVAEAIHALDGVRRQVGHWNFRHEGWSAIKPGLQRTYRQGRAALRTARREPTVENLHEWRKRVKDLWYDARLLSRICGPIMAGYAQEAEALSELLGDDHDLAMLRENLADDALEVVALIDERRSQLQAEARRVGRRLYAESPKAFVKRTRRLWKAGRKTGAQPISSRRPKTRSNASSSP